LGKCTSVANYTTPRVGLEELNVRECSEGSIYGKAHWAYGLLAFLPGLKPETRTLIVEGTSSVGTECASDFLLDELSLSSFIEQISSRSHKKLPYFEVLLQSAIVVGNAQQPQIVAYRIIDR